MQYLHKNDKIEVTCPSVKAVLSESIKCARISFFMNRFSTQHMDVFEESPKELFESGSPYFFFVSSVHLHCYLHTYNHTRAMKNTFSKCDVLVAWWLSGPSKLTLEENLFADEGILSSGRVPTWLGKNKTPLINVGCFASSSYVLSLIVAVLSYFNSISELTYIT